MEKVIGTWINNKPIYRKTINHTITGDANWNSYSTNDIDISKLDIEKVITVNSIIKGTDNFVPSGNGYNVATGLSTLTHLILNTSTPVIRFRHNQYWISGGTLFVTLEYTKTTD